MQRETTILTVREILATERSAGKTVGLVPTMGALHAGHVRLIEQARAACDVVVASVFVNPTQFNDPADLEKYPRDLERDAQLLAQAGTDVLFAPPVAEMYPDGFSTQVVVSGPLAERLEGEKRPGHFIGVATVVCKLLSIIQSDQAFFGEKDFQQLQLIRKMARDLNLPVEIVPVATVRAADQVALSSRNTRLSPEARRQAVVIPFLLDTAQEMLDAATPEHRTDQAPVLQQWLGTLFQTNAPDARLDYLAIVDPETFDAVFEIRGPVLVAIAAFFDNVRLIDNRVIQPAG